MPSKDYYAILGVDKKATETQIRTAFRKLAKKYHPDVNSGSKVNENKFKEINEAYEILRDKKKRAQYDQIREAEARGFTGFGASPGGQPSSGGFTTDDLSQFGFGNLGDLFGTIFGSRRGFDTGYGGFGQARGEDLQFETEISFEQAIHGGSIILSIPKKMVCPKCQGSGAQPGTQIRNCQNCMGAGTMQFAQGGFSVSRPCPQCAGRGQLISTPCSECHGNGEVNKTRRLRVKIPNGVDNGTKIRIPGEGHPGPRNTPPGDLYVIFRVQNHDLFKREGKNIYIEQPINIFQALLGSEIEVPTLDGKVRVKVPAGSQPGTLLRLKGRGVSQKEGLGKGDQFVRIKVVIPKDLTAEQISKIVNLAKSMGIKI